MLEILNRPYPLEISWEKNIRISLFTGIFIAIFLYVFQPVNVIFLQGEMSLSISLVYGIISFSIMIISFYFIPKYFPSIFNEEYWTVKKELVHLLLSVLIIAFFNYLFVSFFSLPSLSHFFGSAFISVFGSTFLLSIFPLSAIVFYKQNSNLKKYLEETELINASIHKVDHKETITIKGKGKNESITFQYSELLFIKSQGNYCSFYFDSDKKEEMLRVGLADIQNQILSNQIFKCHRSYLVNLKQIEKVSGNAQGLRLHFKKLEESVPVSRSLSGEIRSLLLKN